MKGKELNKNEEREQSHNIIVVGSQKEEKRGYYVADTFLLRSDNVVETQYIPLYDLDAFAGLVPANVEEHKPDDLVFVANIPHCDGTMHVKGDSMYPKLESGDIVAYKTTGSRRGGLCFGEIYVIAYIEDGDEYVVVKYLDESDVTGYYTLRSLNPNYAPKDIPRDSVAQLGIVKGVFRQYVIG